MTKNKEYLTDDEAWRDHERMERVATARKDVSALARKMLGKKDRNRIANLLGVTRETLNKKVSDGKFTAVEFLVLSYLCGFEVLVEDRYQLMLDSLLEDDLK